MREPTRTPLPHRTACLLTADPCETLSKRVRCHHRRSKPPSNYFCTGAMVFERGPFYSDFNKRVQRAYTPLLLNDSHKNNGFLLLCKWESRVHYFQPVSSLPNKGRSVPVSSLSGVRFYPFYNIVFVFSNKNLNFLPYSVVVRFYSYIYFFFFFVMSGKYETLFSAFWA